MGEAARGCLSRERGSRVPRLSPVRQATRGRPVDVQALEDLEACATSEDGDSEVRVLGLGCVRCLRRLPYRVDRPMAVEKWMVWNARRFLGR